MVLIIFDYKWFVEDNLFTRQCRDVVFVPVPSDEFIYGPASPPVEKGGITAITREILSRYSTVFFLPPGADHPLPAYRKLKRVPFSETAPFAFFRLPWGKAAPQKGGVTEGEGIRLIRVNDLAVQPLICFESGFSDLVRQGVSLGADLLAEVSNDGWFASRDAEIKHLGMSVFRAVEVRRPLVRTSNSGAGAHVLASGKILLGTLTPHGGPCLTRARVWSPDVLTLYQRFGDAWLWCLGPILAGPAVAALGLAGTWKRRGWENR